MNRRESIKLAVGAAAALEVTIRGREAVAQESFNRKPGAVEPLKTEFVFEAQVDIGPAVEVGPSARGHRLYIPITGGSFAGPRIKGTVLPGGADWQLRRPDGVLELDALYSIKADDGAVIIVHNRGLLADGGAYLRTVPQFEAPLGPHDWLNKAVFVGSVGSGDHPGSVAIRVFRVV